MTEIERIVNKYTLEEQSLKEKENIKIKSERKAKEEEEINKLKERIGSVLSEDLLIELNFEYGCYTSGEAIALVHYKEVGIVIETWKDGFSLHPTEDLFPCEHIDSSDNLEKSLALSFDKINSAQNNFSIDLKVRLCVCAASKEIAQRTAMQKCIEMGLEVFCIE